MGSLRCSPTFAMGCDRGKSLTSTKKHSNIAALLAPSPIHHHSLSLCSALSLSLTLLFSRVRSLCSSRACALFAPLSRTLPLCSSHAHTLSLLFSLANSLSLRSSLASSLLLSAPPAWALSLPPPPPCTRPVSSESLNDRFGS